jgi:hypothetical protein
MHRFTLSFFIIIISCGTLYFPGVVAAESSSKLYELHLEYNPLTQKIAIDTDATSPYRVISGTTSFSVSPRFSEYYGSVFSGNEKKLFEFGFSHPTIVVSGVVAPLPLRVPYFPNATRIDVYQGSTMLLSLDVTGSSVCRENARCEIEYGETPKNCPSDCEDVVATAPVSTGTVQARPQGTLVTPGALPPWGGVENESVPPTSSTPVLSIIFFVLGLGSFGVWVYLRRRGNS